MEYRVTLDACVEGNPLKAWKGTTGEDDDVHVPDDVWEHQAHSFGDLDAAKDFVRGLHPQTSTHVIIEAGDDDSGWETIHVHDAGADHLDDAAPGVPMPHDVDNAPAAAPDDEVPEAPPLVARQGGDA